MLVSKKGQASVDILIVIIFLLLFLYVYNVLATNTATTLEINRINNQEKTIVLSINNFLKLQDSIIGTASTNNNIVDYNTTIEIPYINIPSKQQGCVININSEKIVIDVNYNDVTYRYSQDTNLSTNDFVLPILVNCGALLSCSENNFKLECK